MLTSILALRRPGYVVKAVASELTFADERFLANATGTNTIQIRRFLQKPFDDPDFLANLRSCEAAFCNGMVSADLWAKKVLNPICGCDGVVARHHR